MKNNSRIIIALAAALASTSCLVTDSYSIDDIDMEMSLFNDKFELPIGNTGRLKLGDFLDSESSDLLKTAADGSYAICMGGDFDLGDKLPDMTELLKVKGFDFSESFSYDLGEFEDGILTVPGQVFHSSADLGGFSGMKDFDIDPVDFKESLTGGIDALMPDESAFALGIEPFNYNLADLFDLSALNPSMLGTGDVTVPSQYMPAAPVDESIKVSYSKTLPEGESVKDVVLSKGSEVVVSVSPSSLLLSGGTVNAGLVIDFTGIFVFEDGTSKIDLSSLQLNAANGFTNSKTFKVKSIDKSCFKGNLISVNNDVKVSGEISIDGAKTNSSLLASAKKFGVNVSVSCDDIRFDDIVVGLGDYKLEEATSVDVKFNEIDLPEQVEGVESVSFTSESAFTLGIESRNLPATLGAVVPELVVTFPSEIEVEGATGGKVTFKDVDLSKPFNKVMKVKSVKIPQPVNGKVHFNGKVDLKAEAVLSGEIRTSSLSSDSADRFSLEFAVKSDLAVSDYTAKIRQTTVSLAQEEQVFEVELPDGLDNFGTFVIVPEGSPVVKFRLDLPSTSLSYKASSEGIVIKVPKMLELGKIAETLNYDSKANSITIKGDIPSEIDLPVSRIIVTPGKNADGKTVASGVFKISGGVVVPSSTISKKEVDLIAEKGVGLDVEIPEIKSASVSMDKFEFKVDAEQKMTLLKAGSLPAEVKSIGYAEMDETYLNLAVDFDNLPSFGAGRNFEVNVGVTLPDFIKPSHFTISGTVKDGKFNPDPVKIESIDFSSLDFSKDIEGTFVFDGSISIDHPSVDLTTLGGEVSAHIKGNMPDIKIKKASAKIDYKIDNISESVKIEGLPAFLTDGETVLDLYNPALNITMITDLGIPVKGVLTINSMKDGKKTASQSVDVELPYSDDGSVKSRTFHLASSSADCPADYEFRQIDFSSLIKTFPDELVVEVNAGTDPEKECTVSAGKAYQLKCSYEFNMPLSLGNDFRVELKDTLSISSDIAGYLDKAATVMLYGEVENSLPVEIAMELQLLDANGNVLPLSAPAAQIIKARNSDGKASVSPLEIAISHSSSIANATSIELVFAVTSGGAAGNAIKETDYVQASLGASVKGGISIDPKKL